MRKLTTRILALLEVYAHSRLPGKPPTCVTRVARNFRKLLNQFSGVAPLRIYSGSLVRQPRDDI